MKQVESHALPVTLRWTEIATSEATDESFLFSNHG
jgi:hypothetical protein